jgi:hypothetical protein
MKSAAPRTPIDRTIALRRLRTLTLGTALAGVLGMVGFGSVAALTYAGKASTTGGTVADNSSTTTTSPDTSSTATATPSASTSGGSSLQAASQTPTATARPAQVTSGGS